MTRLDSWDQARIFVLASRINPDQLVALRSEFWTALTEQGMRFLIADCSQLKDFNPSLISLLVGAQNMMVKEKGRLLLTRLRPDHESFLHQLRLDEYFEIHPDLDSIRAALEPPA